MAGVRTGSNHFSLGGRILGKYKAGAVAEREAVGDVERLEVLGLPGCGGHGGLLGAEQRIDGG